MVAEVAIPSGTMDGKRTNHYPLVSEQSPHHPGGGNPAEEIASKLGVLQLSGGDEIGVPGRDVEVGRIGDPVGIDRIKGRVVLNVQLSFLTLVIEHEGSVLQKSSVEWSMSKQHGAIEADDFL